MGERERDRKRERKREKQEQKKEGGYIEEKKDGWRGSTAYFYSIRSKFRSIHIKE